MEIIVQIVRGIAAVVLLYLLLEMLLPKGELQPYIRMTAGLLLIIAVMAPLQRAEALPPIRSEILYQYDEDSVIAAAEDMRSQWRQEAESAYMADIAAKASSLLALDATVGDIAAEAVLEDGKYLLALDICGQSDRSGKWRRMLTDYFEIDAECISINFTKETGDGEKGDIEG